MTLNLFTSLDNEIVYQYGKLRLSIKSITRPLFPPLPLAAAMAAGDNVTLSLTEKDGGVIKDVRTEPTVVMVYDSINGVYRNEVNEEREDIYIDIEADCAVSDIAITTGDTEIKVGQDIPVRGKGYATNGYIIGINDEGGAQ